MSLKQIVKGTYNNITGREEALFKKRIAICNECPLQMTKFGVQYCCPYLYLNPKTNQVSTVAKEGFYKGCGCVLGSKTRVPEKHCPAKKW